MESPHYSPVIQLLDQDEQTSPIHPTSMNDSEQLDEDILVEGPTFISDHNPYLASWLKNVHDVNEEAGPSNESHLLNEDQLIELYGDQMDGFYHIAQQLLTSK